MLTTMFAKLGIDDATTHCRPKTVVPLVGTRTLAHAPAPMAVDKLAATLTRSELQMIAEQKPLKK